MHAKRLKLRKPMPMAIKILNILICTGFALVIYAYFHHVRPEKLTPVGTVSRRKSFAAAAETAAPDKTEISMLSGLPAATPLEATEGESRIATPVQAEPEGCFSSLHGDKFTDGEVIYEENRYVSKNLSVTIETHTEENVVYHIADVYIRDISSFKTVLANDNFGIAYTESILDAHSRSGSVVTMNGDNYGARREGLVIRNGMLLRSARKAENEYLVLYWDGTMEIFEKGAVDEEMLMEDGAYQAWHFGPSLLDENAEAKTKFNSKLMPANPRSAIGYYEPGHYCLVMVEGRSSRSQGMTLSELSELMHSLGCKIAYNLDGGQTAQLAYHDGIVNEVLNSGRMCSDYIVFTEPDRR